LSGLGGANSKKPIDIESDRLEVDDKVHLATFVGSVSAVQGNNNLRAPRLEVIYEKAADSAGAATGSQPVKPVKQANAGASGDPVSSGQVKAIHANGGKVVFMNKADEQEATGEDALYDTKGQKITMTGKDVVLTQKKSVVEGIKLEMDLATGLSTVTPKERVRALLTPEKAVGNPLTGGAKKKGEQAESPGSKTTSEPSWLPFGH
jgi:lipopolysaccharide export system protein LptA